MGRTVVPVHPAAGPDELASTLDYCDVAVVLSDEDGLARLMATPLARRVVITHVRSQLVGTDSDPATGRHASLGGAYDPDGVAVLLHTSGTPTLWKKLWKWLTGPPTRIRNARVTSDTSEHPQRDSNPCRHLERVVS